MVHEKIHFFFQPNLKVRDLNNHFSIYLHASPYIPGQLQFHSLLPLQNGGNVN